MIIHHSILIFFLSIIFTTFKMVMNVDQQNAHNSKRLLIIAFPQYTSVKPIFHNPHKTHQQDFVHFFQFFSIIASKEQYVIIIIKKHHHRCNHIAKCRSCYQRKSFCSTISFQKLWISSYFFFKRLF